MRRGRFLTTAAVLLATTGLASASVVVKFDEATLTRGSHAVLTGRVIDTYSKWSDSGEYIVTFTRIQVDQRLKGELDARAIVTVREVGGTVGDYSQEMIGAATFASGERVLVFLEKAADRTPGVYQTLGLSQGKFRIVESAGGRPVVVSDAHGLHYVGTARAIWDDGPVSLDEFLTAIRSGAGAR